MNKRGKTRCGDVCPVSPSSLQRNKKQHFSSSNSATFTTSTPPFLFFLFFIAVHTMGVSAEPEMTEHRVDGSDCFLILATDGIWDVVESAQAVQLVAQHLQRALTASGGGPAVTAVVVCLLAVCLRCAVHTPKPLSLGVGDDV